MADRTIYGKNFSENGWRMVDQGSCVWVKVPGTNVSLQIREGQPVAILGAFAADFNAYVEPLRDADSACWTATNSVATSNHLSGTGMDLNWNGPDGKTFRLNISKERAYPGQKAKALDDLLDFYEGIVFCGGDWSIRDWMHMQLGANTYGSQNVNKVNDFIRRKIRADGFSTYKRNATAPPPVVPPVVPQPSSTDASVLARAAGISQEKANEILVGVRNGLCESDAINANRIAMWLAQMGHESGGFRYTEEIASGAAYEGRRDLGNVEPGDGVRFKGRSWIQVTGRANYARLSKWAFEQGIVPTPTFFTDDSTRLGRIEYAGLGPAWYWTVARPQINKLSDERNLTAVTQAINGGQNGAADRKARYDRAMSLGGQLLVLINDAPTQGEDELSAKAEQMIQVIYDEVTKKFASRSPLRHLNEGTIDTLAGFALNTDGHGHVQLVKLLAGYGDPDTLKLLREVAGADLTRYPDRQHDAELARAILAETFDKTNGATATVAAPQPYTYYDQQPVTARVSIDTPQTTGQVIGQAYDALEALQLSGTQLSAGELSTLQALIAVLQTKTEQGAES